MMQETKALLGHYLTVQFTFFDLGLELLRLIVKNNHLKKNQGQISNPNPKILIQHFYIFL